MSFKNVKNQFITALKSLYDEKEIESFFYLILEKLHQLKRIDLALDPNKALSAEQKMEWDSILAQLKTQKPLQYILGETEFYGLPFMVNENVLIPRPETEELVEMILVESRKSKVESLTILDIGTGTGCIPISLKKNLPTAAVFALDVSEKALEIARKNAVLNNVTVGFLQKDILKTEDLGQQFDVIVSNPPYVRNLEKAEIKPNVLEFEPHLALFVDDNDALLFYRKIALLAQKNLNPNGKLYFEINQYLGNETVALLEQMGFQDVVLKKDLHGNDRMISCSL